MNRRAFAYVGLPLFVASMAIGALFPITLRYRDGRGRFGREGPSSSTASYAFFEFAPLDGAGMGAACAGTTPTGAKGEVLTFARASAAGCFKGSETTGILNGDFVDLTSGQPRVGTGGSGALKIGVWEARTNSLLQARVINNAAWTPRGDTVPRTAVVTANFATGPDNQLSAERVVTFACAVGGTYSDVIQTFTGTAAAWTGSLFVKGNGTSGNVNLFEFDSTAVAGTVKVCAYNATTWTRCDVTRTYANTTHRFSFGCINDVATFGAGAVDVGALDILVWHGQDEAGSNASPPIDTLAAAATRVQENFGYDLGAGSTLTATSSSIAATQSGAFSSTSPLVVGTSSVSFSDSNAKNGLWLYAAGSAGVTMKCLAGNDTPTYFTTGTAVVGTGERRGWCSGSGVTNGAFNGTTMTVSGAHSGSFLPYRYVMIGGDHSAATNSKINGWVGQVIIDASPTRAR